ncbi:MAG: TRAP transporter fused permease subunit, partial [Alphaproteobacteria bacterium]|nr:TRAP transporter fused permease subunit [Alphaproteobacteria bacterium]
MSQFIFIFIVFAGLLDSTGAGQVFINLAFALTGRFRGGPAQSAVAASSMFGMVSGSTMANVVTTGAFTIPLMIRTGFSRVFSGAVEAVASCGGQIVPPIMGASVFIMSEIIGVPYAHLMLYALIPAVLYFGSLSCAIYFESLRLGLGRLPPSEIPNMREHIRAGGYMLIPILFLLGSIVSGETPGLAGFKAVVALLVLADLVRSLQRIRGAWGNRAVVAVSLGAAGIIGLCYGGVGHPDYFQSGVVLPILGEISWLRLLLFGIGILFIVVPALRRLPVILPLSLAIADWQTLAAVVSLVGNPVLAIVIGVGLLGVMIALIGSAAYADKPPARSDTGLAKLGGAIVGGFEKGAKNALSLVAATYVIGTIVGLLVLTALGVRISILVTDVAATSLFLAFFLVMIASLIMGMGLPTVAAYLLLVIVVAPAIGKLGASLVAAHMFIFYYGVLSSITPPVALAAYGASGLSGADAFRTSLTACRLAVTAFVVPYLFVYHPELLLLEGTAGEIIYRLAVSSFGILFISMAAIGHGMVVLGAWARALLVGAALLLFFDAAWINGIGLALGLGQLLHQYRLRPRKVGGA